MPKNPSTTAGEKAVNAGPRRGNNAFPASNAATVRDRSRTVPDRAADDTSGGAGGRYGKGSDFEKAADTAAASSSDAHADAHAHTHAHHAADAKSKATPKS